MGQVQDTQGTGDKMSYNLETLSELRSFIRKYFFVSVLTLLVSIIGVVATVVTIFSSRNPFEVTWDGWIDLNAQVYIGALHAIILIPTVITLVNYLLVLRLLGRAVKTAADRSLVRSYKLFVIATMSSVIGFMVYYLYCLLPFFLGVVLNLIEIGGEMDAVNRLLLASYGGMVLAFPGFILTLIAVKKFRAWAVQILEQGTTGLTPAVKNGTNLQTWEVLNAQLVSTGTRAIKRGINILKVAALLAVSIPFFGILISIICNFIGFYTISGHLVNVDHEPTAGENLLDAPPSPS